jgi:hypothetical protein
MKNILWVAVLMATAIGCDKKKGPDTTGTGAPALAGFDAGTVSSSTAAHEAGAIAPQPTFADTSALWALAPANATVGLVVGDGVAGRLVGAWADSLKKLEGKPFAKKTLEQLDGLKKEAGFDVLDEGGYRAKGIDLSKGFAVFAPAAVDMPSLLVLPVGDRDAFRKTINATVEKVGEREIDKSEDIVCTVSGTRYACAKTVEQIDAAFKPHESPLAATVRALPAEKRGDVEVFVDVAKTPSAQAALVDAKPFGDFSALGGALRFNKGGMSLVGWGKGVMGPVAMMLASTPPPAEFAQSTAGATSVMRVRFDPKLFAATGTPATLPGPHGEQLSLTELLTGDVQLVTAGKGILAGALFIKVSDPGKVKPLVASLCSEAKAATELPISGLVAKEDSCSGEVSLAALKDAVGVELPPFKFRFAVTSDVLQVVLGDLDATSLNGSVASEVSGPEIRTLLTGAQTVALYSRNLDVDVSMLPKDLAAKIMAEPDVADALKMMSWSASQAYDVAAGFAVEKDGFRLELRASTFASDPPEARSALEAALDQRSSGDRAAFLTALGAIEQKFPSSLAARRAKLERLGTPIFGPLLGVAAGAGAGAAYFARATATAPRPGGFGERGAVPTESPSEGAERVGADDKAASKQGDKSNHGNKDGSAKK